MVGYFELVMGCMFSGKSTHLLDAIKVAKSTATPYIAVTHASDDRYASGAICTHDLCKENAIPTTSLMPLVDLDEYKESCIVFVEEAHFFKDLEQFVKTAIGQHGKKVMVAALDGTFNMEPFENVARVIPFADTIVKKYARCSVCSGKAAFSMRLVESKETILVGAANMYQPVCRQHHRL